MDEPQMEISVNHAHLRRYPQYLRACGFKSVQIMELDRYRGGGRGKKEDVQDVLRTLAEAAHAEGLAVTMFIHGSNDGFHWADPKTRPQREERYRELARRYGKVLDHIVTHWIDDGDEGGYQTPLEATAFLRREFHRYNPNVTATCDAWGNGALYAGIADEKYAPKDVGIALERWYQPDQAKKVKAAGRRVGIWGWYIGDYEMNFASHLEGRILEKYFSALPEQAAEDVDWLSLELCFHAMPSEINLFIAGQKMWTPKRPLKAIALDYCRSVYGPRNAEAMQLVYETVEEGQKDYKYYGMFIPTSDKLPPALGTPEFKARAEKALGALKGVQIPEGWKPNFPVVGDPQEDIESLRRSLEAFVQGKTPAF